MKVKPIAKMIPVFIERYTYRRNRRGIQIGCKWVSGVKLITPEGLEVQPYTTAADARDYCREQGWKAVFA